MKALLLTALQVLFTFWLYVLGIIILGLSIFPGVLLCYVTWAQTATWAFLTRILVFCFVLVAGYFVHGFALILIVGFLRVICRLNLHEGNYPIVSAAAAKWFIANALQTLVSVTFMDFILLTPFASLFYRVLGARLGRNVQINSKFCADASLLEIGDGSVIGGHATVIGHVFEHDRLILRKVKIGKRVVVGLNAIVLPGSEIGDGALIAAGAVLPKDAKIRPRSVYLGVSAESIKEKQVA